MGVTSVDIPILNRLINNYKIKSVIELGAQNNYAQPHLPAPYMRAWYERLGIKYDSIDLTGECGAIMIDLGKPQEVLPVPYDLVTDFGTSEHVSDDGNSYGTGKFSWESIYNCWKAKFDLCKLDGWIISENPKTGNWPGHGFQYYTSDFYIGLANLSGLGILMIDEIAAMGNTTDGWNILCIMHKVSEKFPSLEEFKTLDLRQI